MKKTMLFLATLMCCATLLCSCGSDNDEPKVTPTAIGIYTIVFGDDFFDAAKHVVIYYKGNDGENKSEVMTSGLQWTKTITSKRFPAELGLKIEIEPAEEEDLTKDVYNVTLVASIAGSVDTGGNFANSQTLINSSAVQKNQVLDLLRRNKEKTYGYRLTRDGDASQYTPSF